MWSFAPPGFPGTPAPRGRILVVEHDPDGAEFFRHVLSARGRFDVTQAADPALALRLAICETWSLVLVGEESPLASGRQLLTALRPLAPRLPAVLVTAQPFDAGPSARWGARPDAVLAKPVSAGVLLSTVAALIARGETAAPGAGHGPGDPV